MILRAALLAAAISLPVAASAAEPAAAAPFEANYKPQNGDERGLWMQFEEVERELKNSNFVITDPKLNAYVKGVLCRAVGADRCDAARIYLVRSPSFNASMAPNGMMQVWSGLLLRTRNEAQLAAVLAHEFGHFEQRHSLRMFRDIRAKTDAAAWLGFIPYVGLIAQLGVVGSVFSFSRDMEREADMHGLKHVAAAGYQPKAFAGIWAQLRNEQDATASERQQKSRKDKNGGFFATHPNTAERMTYLTQAAAELKDGKDHVGTAEYRAAMADWWAPLIDDQIKLNDFGGTEFLLANLAGSEWTSELLYARGELYRARGKAGDFENAAGFYREAIAKGSALAEAHRGLGLALLRTGAGEEGRAAIKEYLQLKPDAGDRAMMAMMAGGE